MSIYIGGEGQIFPALMSPLVSQTDISCNMQTSFLRSKVREEMRGELTKYLAYTIRM